MIIGIPKEVKVQEYRIGATPALVHLLVQAGHTVLIERGAAEHLGFSDADYTAVGAKVVAGAKEVYAAEMIVKVKEPQEKEFPYFRKGQILFCFLHLVACPEVFKHLIERKVIAVAYETVKDQEGRLPLLTPMSEVAGRLSVQEGANALQIARGGKGIFLGGVPGVRAARVLVLGGGVSGTQAARMAMGLGADVTIVERRLSRLRELDDLYGPRLKTLFSTPLTIQEEVARADLVIGAVLVPGRKAPKLLTERMIASMEPGSAFIDLAIDQGGCSETSRPTTYHDPIYKTHGVVHFCVTNVPAACARTSSAALANATTPYVLALANKGAAALFEDKGFLEGLNLAYGHVTSKEVAEDMHHGWTAPQEALCSTNTCARS